MKLNEHSNERTRGGIVLISALPCLLTNPTKCRVNVSTFMGGPVDSTPITTVQVDCHRELLGLCLGLDRAWLTHFL